MRLIDVSPVLHPGIGVWPGDVPLTREVALSIADGANLDLSSIRTTVHVGAHADAPSHYVAGGASIEARPLGRYLGPCQVIAVDVPRGRRVRPDDLRSPVRAPRVLLHTGSFPDPDTFTTDFCSLSPELVHALADAGVVLVGVDTPSVDPFDSKALESHQALAARDLAVLEGLTLGAVAPGLYTLIALPLPIRGADASPVRAILIDDGGNSLRDLL
ncbi:MAG TPA: cyclase family protein [Myxococcota bacterium]|nr:cyclase family protein [Myxococcota bacterium]